MASNVLRFCFQAFIIQSLTCAIMDVSCIGLASYAATPYAVASAYTVPPLASAYAAAPYTPPIAAPLAMPYTAAPIIPAPARYAPTFAASNGGGLTVTSVSPVPPNGVSLLSENSITGRLAVAGEVPFLSAVTLDGALPTVGSGVVSYTCGNGELGMLAEDFTCGYNRYGYDGYAMPLGYGYDVYGPGYGYNPYTGYRMY